MEFDPGHIGDIVRFDAVGDLHFHLTGSSTKIGSGHTLAIFQIQRVG